MKDDLIKQVTREVMAAIEPAVESTIRDALRRAMFGLPGLHEDQSPHAVAITDLPAPSKPPPGVYTKVTFAKGPKAAKAKASGTPSLDAVLTALRDSGAEGLRAEDIRAKLSLGTSARRKLNRLLVGAIAAKKVTKKGVKRSTRYFAAK